ncbi:hypothetical protein [Phocaeicola sartorii]|uniref:Fimbrial subunit protein C-terminal domain-containing protein n=1 Tax=Phocaeicola sartorii TaxID=671267 RepID=R9I6U1_9BACT|nr:hypothetical protein [Phocaeicola sartorii]EOS11924.1 hypothetical protein C802_02499 [Phocaeicola sartorii]MCR1846079.1 hypothetical protein [Phocaeicola sartorii]NUK98969.1 hypothetical protein [Phocaeicola sartorii]
MRKINLFSAAVLLALGASVASCSDESGLVDNSKVEVPELKGEQEVVLKVASAGDGLVSRAGRPLYSSEAAQKIDKVKIVIVKCAPGNPAPTYTVVASKLIEDWMNVSQDYATGGHGKQYTWRLGADEKLEYDESSQDTYMVYAIGYTNAGLYKTSLDNFENLTTGDFNWVSSALTAENLAALDLGEEVFAGSLENLTIDKEGGFTIKTGGENVLTLHRQVSGITGYFTNVPTFPAGKQGDVLGVSEDNYLAYTKGLKLQLVSSNANDQIIFAGFNSSFQETGKDVKYIVNGSQSGEWNDKNSALKTKFDEPNQSIGAYKIYEIKLESWFPQGDTSKDGYLGTLDAYDEQGNPNDNWVSPYGSGNTVDFRPGSVFAGKFVIPFTKVPNTKTLELQLVATKELPATASAGDATSLADNPIVAANTIIKSWRINLSSTDEQLGTTAASNHVEVVQKDGIPAVLTGNNSEEKFDSYSIVRNHLYGVGVKSTDGYDPDKDKPEDLSKGQTLILKVNDNWELIHKMEIE